MIKALQLGGSQTQIIKAELKEVPLPLFPKNPKSQFKSNKQHYLYCCYIYPKELLRDFSYL